MRSVAQKETAKLSTHQRTNLPRRSNRIKNKDKDKEQEQNNCHTPQTGTQNFTLDKLHNKYVFSTRWSEPTSTVWSGNFNVNQWIGTRRNNYVETSSLIIAFILFCDTKPIAYRCTQVSSVTLNVSCSYYLSTFSSGLCL